MSNKAELKLLARQHPEQSWSAIPGEENLSAEEANNFNTGALVLVELTSNRQIQSIQEAAKQLVGILQNFSRQQEKSRGQAEEIEGWKQSLIYQSQELTQRKLEMEAWEDELQQSEEALKELEQQRQEVEANREEIQRQREEAEDNRQELENAWSQLQAEQHRLQEHHAELQQTAILDNQQIRSLEGLLNRLPGAVVPAEFQEQLATSLELIVQQQTVLDQHRQKLEQQSVSAQDRQAEVDRQTKHIEDSWKAWQQAQDSLKQASTELKLKQQSLRLKEECVQTLALQLQAQKDLYRQLSWLTNSSEGEIFGDEADMQALAQMPVEELKSTIEGLQQGLEKVSRFVHDQEEELALQHQAVEELQEQIKQVSENDRPSLEEDLEFEQQRYQMLGETLVGQRRSLREREAILGKHQIVLLQRQGHQQGQDKVDLEPILSQLKSQRQRQGEELQKLESQIKQIQSTIQQLQETVHHQSQDQDAKYSELKQLELTLQNQKSEIAELWGRINAYQEILQPVQDRLSELHQKLISVTQSLRQSDGPGQVIAEIRKIMTTLTQSELVAS